MKIVLKTPRLYLREFNTSDAGIIFKLNSDMEVVKYTGNPPMKELKEAIDVLNNFIIPAYESGYGRWAVHIIETDECIGWCGLKETETGIDLGYRFFKHTWGKGYGSESAKAVLQYAFDHLKVKQVIAHVVIQNKNSQKILEKIGMVKTKMVEETNRTIQCYALSAEIYNSKQPDATPFET